MPTEIEAVGVLLPRRGEWRDEHASGRLEVLARNVARTIRAELSDRPRQFAFFGHSLGALLAYEVARRLSAAGWRPELTVLSGSRAPSRRPRVVLHAESDAQLLAGLDRMGGMSSTRLHDTVFLHNFLPRVRSDLTMAETYRPACASPLPCPVSVWAAREDWYAPPDETARWRDLAGPAYRSRLFAGDHFFIKDWAAVTAALLSDLRWSQTCRYSDRPAALAA